MSSRKHLLVALLAFSSLTSGERAFAAGALPSGGQFAAGAGSIAAATNGVNVTQSTSRGVINWQSFSIGQGNTVNIANGAGATLNRVTGGDISSIAGSLTSTGSVYVINQAGVLVTPTGKVNTVGTFVASTRDLANSSFMAGGAQNFVGNSAGTVVNQGSITSANGDVVLVGKSVSNSGQIAAPNGNAILAAGDNVVLQPAGGDSQILIGAGSGDVTNTGTIDAAQAELNAAGGNVYALASNNGGIVRASGTAIKDGHVYLTAGDDVNVSGAVTATNADGSGGTIKATGGAGPGTLNVTGSLTASATGSAAKGGTIVATAATVNIGATANIVANGGAGGGTVLIGGDRHGGTDPAVALSTAPIANAKNTTVASGAKISADAGANGNGGNVVVWSDQYTSFAGSISAQGGSVAGNGGFVEVSGAQQLGFTGAVTTAAINGASGTLLLDPEDVTIVNSMDPNGVTTTSPGVTNASGTFTSTSGTSYILNTTIDAALAVNNVVISTGSLGDGRSGKGDIHFGTSTGGPNVNAAPIYWSSSNSLTLNALGLIDTPGGNPSTATGGFDPSSPGTLVHSIGGGAITFSASANGAVQTAQTVISITGDIVGSGGLMSFISTSPTYRIEVGNNTTVSNSTALGAGTIVFQADQVRFGTGTGPAGAVKTPNGELDIRPTSAGAVVVGDTDPTGAYANNNNTSLIRSEDITNATANLVVIGGTSTTTLTIQNVNPAGEVSNGGYAAFDAVAANNLKFLTGTSGSVVQDVATPIIVNDPNFTLFFGTGGLAVQTGGAITLNSPYNSVGTIAFKQTGAGGDIGFIRQADTPSSDGAGGNGTGLIIGTVGDVSGITTVGTRTVTLTANETAADPNAFTTGTLGPLAVTQASGAANAITTTNLVVQGPTSSFTLDNPANAVSKVAAASVGSLTLYDNINLNVSTIGSASGITGTGAITLVDNGTLTIDSGAPITTTGGNVRIEDGSPNTTFSSPATLNTGFVNNDGTAAFNVTGGNWRVYSQDPRSDNDGGLTAYNFVQYAATNSYATPFTTADAALNVGASGNGFLYTVAPTIAQSLTGTFNRTYNGTSTISPGLTSSNYSTASGAINGDTLVLNDPTAAGTISYNSIHAGASVTGVPTISLTSATDHAGATIYGYATNFSSNVTGTITALPIVISGARVYDGTNNADVTGAGISITNVQAADAGSAPTISGVGTGALNGIHVGSRTVGSFANYTLGNNSHGDYTLVGATGSVTISAAPLTITGTKTYNGNNSFAVGQLTIDPATVVAGDTVTLASGTGASTSGGAAAVNVGNYGGSTLSGVSLNISGNAQAGDYSIPPTGTLSITPATLTISGAKSYDGLTTAPIADINTTTIGGTAVTGLVGSDSFGTNLTLGGIAGATGSANKGTYTGATGATAFTLGTLSLSGTGSGNYTLAAGTFTINPASLTITPKAVSVVYDGSTLDKTAYSDALSNYTINGLQNAETTTSAGISLTGSMAFAGSTGTAVHNAATYSQAVGSLGLTSNNSNYSLNFTNPTPNNYVITPATLTISGQKTYDAAATAPSADINTTTTAPFALTGLVAGDAFGAGGDLALSGTGTTGSANAGTYTGPTGATKFILGGLTLGAGTNGDASGNYTLAAGTFQINTAVLTVTTANGTRAYDGTTNANAANITLAGLQGGDATGPGGDLSLVGSGVTGSPNKGTYTGATGPTSFTLGTLALGAGTNGNVSANYTLQAGTFTITAANLTVTASPQSKVYGTTGTLLTGAQTTDFTTSALQNGESVSGVTLTATPAALLATTDAGTAGLTMTPSAATGSGTFLASNYNITYNTGAITITPAQLTASGTKAYDGTVNFISSTPGQLVLAGGVNSQTVTLLLGGSATSSSPNANSYTSTTFAPNGFAVTGGTGNDLTSNYTLPTTAALTISPAALTITASAQSKVYGTTTGTLLEGSQTTDFTTSALPNSESVSSVTLMPTAAALLATTDAGTAGLVNTPSAATGSGSFLSSNYNITYNTGAITITKAPLTASGTKAYDGTVNFASSTAGQLVLAGGVNNQTVTLSAGGTATSSSPNANSYTSTTFTPNGFTVTGGLGNDLTSNYQLPTTAALTISPAALTITASAQSKVYGTTTGTLLEGSQTTDFTTSALPNGESVGSVTLTPTAAALLATTNAGTGGLVNTPSAATAASGGAFLSSNYNITYNTGAITITPAQLTASGTKAYDGTANFASSTPGQLVLAGGVNGQTVSLIAGGTATSSSPNANSYTSTTFSPNGFTVTGGTGTDLTSNYTLPTTAALTINPAALTITPNSTSKTYGTALTFAGTEFTTTPLVGGQTIGSVTLTSAGTPATAAVAGSPYAINGSNATGGTFNPANYSITYNTGTLTVNPLGVTVSGTRTYNGTPNAPGTILTVIGEIPSDPTLTLTGTGTLQSPNANPTTPTTITSLGNLALTGPGSSNYVLTGGTVTINPAPLSITANNQTKTYGSTLTFNGTEFTPSGLQGSDTVGTVTLVSPGTPATAAVAGSPYGITPSAATGGNFIASNYTITYNPGTLTVNPLGVTVTGTRVYDGTPNAPSTILTVVGELPGDPTLTTTGTGTLQSPNVNPADPITSLGTLVLTGTGSSNYVLNGGTVAITPAALTVTANNRTKTYGTAVTFAGTEFTSSGLQGSDTIGRVTLVSAGTPATAPVAGSPYSITPSAATGGTFAASNYTIRYVAGTLTINPLAVTVTGSRLFNGGSDASGTILTVLGELAGDPTLTLSGTGTLAGPDANAIPTPITALGTLALVGPGSTNYVLTSGAVLITAPVTQVNVPDQTAAGAGVQTVGVFTNGILLPRPQQNGVVGGKFATGAGCEDGNAQCDVPLNGAAAAEATGTQSGTELISGKKRANGS